MYLLSLTQTHIYTKIKSFNCNVVFFQVLMNVTHGWLGHQLECVSPHPFWPTMQLIWVIRYTYKLFFDFAYCFSIAFFYERKIPSKLNRLKEREHWCKVESKFGHSFFLYSSMSLTFSKYSD